MRSEVRLLFRPDAKDPILIGGLPGVGHVGKLASDYLISQISAKKFAEQISPYFPHYSILEKGGLLRPSRYEMYWGKVNNKDLFILTGECPITTPEGHYEVAMELLKTIEELGVKEIYMLGGYISPRVRKQHKTVVIVNRPKLAECKPSKVNVGPIIGLTGMLVSLAGTRGIKGTCLLAEAGDPVLDSVSARLLLEKLCELLNIKLDLSALEIQTEATRRWIEKMKEEIEKREVKKESTEWYIG